MNDMPEKIMAWPAFDSGVTGTWSANTYNSDEAFAYVRADLAAERERKLMRYVSHDSFCTPALGRDECSCGLCAVRKELGYE